MLDISFLKPNALRVGTEFLDFQSTDMFNELSSELNNNINFTDNGKKAELDDSVCGSLAKIVERHTGFSNLSFETAWFGNLGIDIGYFNPGNIFNSEGIENFYPPKDSTLGRWFTQNKGKVFKGDIDYKTGRVSGAYATVPLTCYINKNIHDFVAIDMLPRYKVTVSDAVAAFICHEIGHVFSMLMGIHQYAYDNFVIQSAIRHMAQTKNNKDRSIILKDAKQLLDLDDNDDKKLIESIQNGDNTACFFYLNSKIENRNSNRALSVGVKQMSAEVIADMYAIRMGCGRELVGGLAALSYANKRFVRKLCWTGALVFFVYNLFVGIMISVLLTILYLPILVISAICMYWFLRAVFFIFGWGGNLIPSNYNTEYRRMTDAISQMVQQLKEDKNSPASVKMRLIADIESTMKTAAEFKPAFEDTLIQRMLGSICTLGKFKYENFEHFTQNLANHKINVLSEKFQLGV